jgi:hypothetical protein
MYRVAVQQSVECNCYSDDHVLDDSGCGLGMYVFAAHCFYVVCASPPYARLIIAHSVYVSCKPILLKTCFVLVSANMLYESILTVR